jgi:hypothetical protein
MQPNEEKGTIEYETESTAKTSPDIAEGEQIRLEELQRKDEPETYTKNKPRRIVIRARITHDES